MPSYQDVTREIGDQWVAALKRTEDALASVAQGVRDRVDLPQIPVPDRLSRLNDALSDRVPLPSEMVKANFELTARLLAAQPSSSRTPRSRSHLRPGWAAPSSQSPSAGRAVTTG